jgi:hypothetical protein
MLSPVMYDLGQVVRDTCCRAQTGLAESWWSKFSQPQCLFCSKPDRRQMSHFQPAWLDR